MAKQAKSVGSFARILVVAAGTVAGITSEGCGCGDDPTYNGNGPDGLECGDCEQYAYGCIGPEGPFAVCAPEDMTAAMLCPWWDAKVLCAIAGDTGGGTDGPLPGDDAGSADANGADETGNGADETGSAGMCENWDPDSYINYNRATKRYEVDRVLLNDLLANPLPLTECDSTRSQIRSGGFFELVHVAPDDVATHLGLIEHDTLKSINGYTLLLPSDYETAYAALATGTLYTLIVERSGRQLTLKYEVR